MKDSMEQGVIILEGPYRGLVGYVWKAEDTVYHIKRVHPDGFVQYVTNPRSKTFAIDFMSARAYEGEEACDHTGTVRRLGGRCDWCGEVIE